MAITDTTTRFLFLAKSLGVSFSKTLTIGRQQMILDPLVVEEMITKYLLPKPDQKINPVKDNYADPLLKLLGAMEIDCLDYSAFEGANILHDMNLPISLQFHNKYSLVIDGGSLEHIFNFPMAIQNCMNLVKEGGHFISFAPMNNLMGHGFYQFSPELFYRIFVAENGFSVQKMFMVAANFFVDTTDWYEVKDPKEIEERVMLCNTQPTYLLLLAKKEKHLQNYSVSPIQSDYTEAWLEKESENQEAVEISNIFKKLYRRFVNEKTRSHFRRIYNNKIRDFNKTEDLERINKRFFKKFKSK